MITATQLTKCFNGAMAVDGLSFQVERGELFALLGPNGAGKTNALNCLLGFIVPDSGSASIAGIDVATRPREARRELAYIPEQVSLYGHFSALENLRYFSELAARKHSTDELRAFLGETGLDAAAHHRRTSTYSKGMRQKVAIAIALAKQARVLLLDEPTSGLDPSASHEFSSLLHKLRDRGIAILMATHDLFRAKGDATRIGIMRHGRLARSFAAADLGHADLEALYLEVMRE